MAVIRQANLLGQQRFDIPHIRSIEAAVAGDFDLLAGEILAGMDPLVVTGFETIVATAGSPASSLQIRVAGSIILHPEASESGTIFKVPEDRDIETLNAANSRVSGSFTASATNYVGVDLRRSADPTTADTVQFLDPETNLEAPKTVPLARTLDYVFVVSTQDFSTTPGIAPLVKVVTDSFNNISSIEDARNFIFRLGSGGAITDTQHAYTWPGGRGEVGDNSDFTAGDKAIGSQKEWMDAIMTRIWEIGGGERWYSATADRNVKLLRTGDYFDNGEWFEWDGTNLHWKGLTMLFDNSTAVYNEILNQEIDEDGLTNLEDGDCIYVDVSRTENKTGGDALQPVKAALSTLSYPTIPGSRFVIAWRFGSEVYTRDTSFPVNASFRVATDTITGIVQLTYPAGDITLPLVMPQDADGSMTNTATANNGFGLKGVGNGNGTGVVGIGSLTTGKGVEGYGAANGTGVYGLGGGTGHGVLASAEQDDGGVGNGGVFTGGSAGDGSMSITEGTNYGAGVVASGGNGTSEDSNGFVSLGGGIGGHFSAGGSSYGVVGAGGSNAQYIYNPGGMCMATVGNSYLFICDTGNHRIVRVSANGGGGNMITFAGSINGSSGDDDGVGTAASFNGPTGITTDGTYLYVADTGNAMIRRIHLTTRVVDTLVEAPIDIIGINDIHYDSGSTALYATIGSQHYIAKITLAGTVTVFAGGAGVSGTTNANGTSARFSSPGGITGDGTYLYVADTGNHGIRAITIANPQTVTTLAGTLASAGSADGTGGAATFRSPKGIYRDSTNLYITQGSIDSTIRKCTTAGVVTTIAGTVGYGNNSRIDGRGKGATFNMINEATGKPWHDGSSTLYVPDGGNDIIRTVNTTTGVTATVAGVRGASRLPSAGRGGGYYDRNYGVYGVTQTEGAGVKGRSAHSYGFGHGGDFMGGYRGMGLLVRENPLTEDGDLEFRPTVSIRDKSDVHRNGYDHRGFNTGYRSEIREEWDWPADTNTTTGAVTKLDYYKKWSYFLSGASAAIVLGSSFALGSNFSYAKLTSTSSAGRCGLRTSRTDLVRFLSAANGGGDMVCRMEWWAKVSAESGASFFMGLCTNSTSIDPISDTWCMAFRKLSADGQFIARTDASGAGGGSGTSTTNVGNLTADTWYHFAIEFSGDLTPYGAMVRYFINGSKVASHTTLLNIPQAVLAPHFAVTYVSSQRDLYIGPMLIQWVQRNNAPDY